MGLGSEPDHDDGLPPIDVVIPDDARELDGDVQAYHRELRQRRRRERWRSLLRSVRRFPLVTGVILVAALCATFVAVLKPGPDQRASRPPLASPPPAAEQGTVGGLLPDIRVEEDGGTQAVRDLRPAVFALVPSGCGCDQAVDELTEQAQKYRLDVYLVASRRPHRELQSLASTAGHGVTRPIGDTDGVLESTYHVSGLTAILVHRDGVVGAVLRDIQPGTRLERELAPLHEPGRHLSRDATMSSADR